MILRYPGSKAKKAAELLSQMPVLPLFAPQRMRYVEPFCGSLGVALAFMKTERSYGRKLTVLLNDKDYGIYSLWQSVKWTPDRLCARIEGYRPNVNDFYQWKTHHLSGTDKAARPFEAAFRMVALHRMSYSGLGAKAGGPLGGKSQNGSTRLDCRWNVGSLVEDIANASEILNYHNVTIRNLDYKDILNRSDEDDVIYLDPPYVAAGPSLYTHSFEHRDHVTLAKRLSRVRGRWLLSYDNDPLVRQLYQGYPKETMQFSYTASTGENRHTDELLIRSSDDW